MDSANEQSATVEPKATEATRAESRTAKFDAKGRRLILVGSGRTIGEFKRAHWARYVADRLNGRH